ncbi:MAG: hypothetical protein KA004_10140 [Verrucomicrobiales bacterium]|nr:hypothetical protein [Verrucomicrobiales bacterium]
MTSAPPTTPCRARPLGRIGAGEVPGRSRRRGGFSLTELVVVGGLAAAVFTTGAIAFRTIGIHQNRATTFQRIEVGSAITNAFYQMAGGALDTYSAPNYGVTAQAEVLRNVFLEDVAAASAVFCLPRGAIAVNPASAATDKIRNVNYIHPPETTVGTSAMAPKIPFTGPGSALDHPNAFLSLLAGLYPDSTSDPFPFLSQAYRGVPSASSPNGSIFILQATDQIDKLVVRAVYDIDLLDVSTPNPGVYASVKRYYGTQLTHMYDVFYGGVGLSASGSIPAASQFGPLFACFERRVRSSVAEGTAVDAFKKADNRPFYLVWWPDPAQPRLAGSPVGTLPVNDPRNHYRQHENQTGWSFVIPMFPSL